MLPGCTGGQDGAVGPYFSMVTDVQGALKGISVAMK